MELHIPDAIAESGRLSEQEMLLELAVALFQRERLTAGQAARLAGLGRFDFQQVLAARDIALHYGEEEFEEDLETVRWLEDREGDDRRQ